MNVKKIAKRLHLWGGMIFGVLIFLLCLTGSFLLFEAEITTYQHLDALTITNTPTTKMLPLDAIIAQVQTQLTDDEQLHSLIYSPKGEHSLLFQTNKKRQEQLAVHPHTGEIMGRVVVSPFFQKVREFHRYLLLPYPVGGSNWGRTIVAGSTLFFVIVLVSGIVMWWPRKTRGLGKRLHINWQRGWFRFSSDFHQTTGLLVSLMLLVFALTGLTWSFPHTTDSLLALCGISPKVASSPPSNLGAEKNMQLNSSTDRASQQSKVWTRALAAVQERADYQRIVLQGRMASAYLYRWGNVYACDTYFFSPTSGQLLSYSPYHQQSSYVKIKMWINALHTVSWGNLPAKLLALFVLLIGMALPITGYYIWWTRYKIRQHNRQRKTTSVHSLYKHE